MLFIQHKTVNGKMWRFFRERARAHTHSLSPLESVHSPLSYTDVKIIIIIFFPIF